MNKYKYKVFSSTEISDIVEELDKKGEIKTIKLEVLDFKMKTHKPITNLEEVKKKLLSEIMSVPVNLTLSINDKINLCAQESERYNGEILYYDDKVHTFDLSNLNEVHSRYDPGDTNRSCLFPENFGFCVSKEGKVEKLIREHLS